MKLASIKVIVIILIVGHVFFNEPAGDLTHLDGGLSFVLGEDLASYLALVLKLYVSKVLTGLEYWGSSSVEPGRVSCIVGGWASVTSTWVALSSGDRFLWLSAVSGIGVRWRR